MPSKGAKNVFGSQDGQFRASISVLTDEADDAYGEGANHHRDRRAQRPASNRALTPICTGRHG